MTCKIDGCAKPVGLGGLCWAHRKRKHRGKPLHAAVREYALTPIQRLSKAAIDYADADSEDDLDYERKWKLLVHAAKMFVHKIVPADDEDLPPDRNT